MRIELPTERNGERRRVPPTLRSWSTNVGEGAPVSQPMSEREGEQVSRLSMNQAEGEQTPAPVPLLEPRDGLPPVVADTDAFNEAIATIANGHGPVAIDAERASGYRYSQRAYLVQLRREGSGTVLIDPVAIDGDLSELAAAIQDEEWILHAASQDLPCLDEVGMRPTTLFDTELAGRLLGLPKVSLGVLVETELGFTLEKGHSAADWSTRPLPDDWLRYAALDVELLIDLRNVMEQQLADADKLDWAHEEFTALITAEPREPRADPWRRTSGIHRVRDRRRLAAVRALWLARDDLARSRDIAPSRTLPDAAIIDAAQALPDSRRQLQDMPVFRGRAQRREADRWFGAIETARALPDAELPEMSARAEGPPPPRVWASREPDAAARLGAARAVVAEIADDNKVPAENLLAPDALRRLVWNPPSPPSTDAVAEVLRERGAREWQIALTAEPLATALEPSP